MEESMKLVAKTLYGLESVLADELRALGAEDVRLGRRMVSFSGDKKMLYLTNIRLRTALRVLKPILTFKADDADELYQNLLTFDWSSVLMPSQTFAIDPVIYSETFRHSRFVGYRAKDAIADHFRERYDKRPSVRLVNPDILINVHISRNEVTVSLDSSGDSLHKRGYRIAQTEAPLNEVLAAGILLKAGWQGQTDLIDPMCGSGTFLIEAALIACNISPGIYRSGFGFERWADFDPELYDELINDDSDERPFEHKIYGSDISGEAISIARRNVTKARLNRCIELAVSPMQAAISPGQPTMIVTNPPYGQRLSSGDNDDLFDMIGSKLKHTFVGCKAFILAHKPEQFARIALKPMLKEQLMNGALDCELRGYELFAGTMSEHRQSNQPQKSYEDRQSEPSQRRMQGERSQRPFNRDERSQRPFNRDERPQRPFNRDERSQRPFNRDERSQRPFNRDERSQRPSNRDERSQRPFNRDERSQRPSNRDERSQRPSNRDERSQRPFNRDERSQRPFNRDERSQRPFNRDERSQRSFNRDERSQRPFNRDERSRFPRLEHPATISESVEGRRSRHRIADYRAGRMSQRTGVGYRRTPWPTDRIKASQEEAIMAKPEGDSARRQPREEREKGRRPASTSRIQIIRNEETER